MRRRESFMALLLGGTGNVGGGECGGLEVLQCYRPHITE
jgi:hypothetical protein